MKVYPYLSYCREINETDVNYTYNWEKVWYSSELAEWKWLLTINLYSFDNSFWSAQIFLGRMEKLESGTGSGAGNGNGTGTGTRT